MTLNRIKSYVGMLVLLVCLLGTKESIACTAVTDKYTYSHKKMIEQSGGIYLAKAINQSLDRKVITTTFEVLDIIKGGDKEQVTISFPDFEYEANSSTQFMEDFSLHSDDKFWKDGSGRSQVLTGCETIASFKLGYVYLLFPDFISNSKGAEIINDTSDKWYRLVKENVAAELN
jgi:hypothetical protein